MRQYFDKKLILLQQDYVERLRSLVDDGYYIVSNTSLPESSVAKLKHKSNRRVIILTADYRGRALRQTTNGYLKHIGLY